MGYIHFNDKGWIVDKNGEPIYIVGINYVASYVCTNFLEDFRPDRLEKDLATIAEMGLNAVRIPIYWGWTEPEEGIYNEKMFENFEAFVAMAKKHGLYVMPWFLVGVATKFTDIPYRQGRKLFEGGMVDAAENHLRTWARRYKEEDAILFWDICDEPEWFSVLPGVEQLPFDRIKFNSWLRRMYHAFKDEDPNHLVTCGFGEIATQNYGFTLIDAAELLDLMVTTIYPYDSSVEGLDTARNNYCLGFYAKINSLFGKPVMACEAPGFSSVMYSEAMLGRFFKVSIYSNLVNGATGVMPWCYNDFEESLWTTPAMDNMSREPYFGIIDNAGRIKPSGKELIDFGKFVRDVKITDYTPAKPKVAIYLTEGYYSHIYHTKRKIRAAMQFAKGCGADIQYVWKHDDLTPYSMVIMCMADGGFEDMMKTSEWKKLAEYVEQGGTLVHDYAGFNGLNVYFNKLFGVEVETRHKNYRYDRMILKEDFGRLEEGQELVFPDGIRDERGSMGLGYTLQNGTSIAGEFLKVMPKEANVVATFADGTPALLENCYGAGKAWLITCQLHSGLFEMEYCEYQNHMMFDVYHAIMEREGVYRPCSYVNSELEAGLFEKKNGEKMLILINHGPEANAVQLKLDAALAGMNMCVWDDREGITVKGACLEMTMEAAEVVKLLFD